MTQDTVTPSRVARLWWPLATSWLMMSIELPLVTSVISRLPDDEANLAALSSVVYPLALLIEAPIIMLLAASTALAKDWPSYQRLWRFTHLSGLILTVLHAVLAFTPLYDLVATQVIDVAESAVEPGRIGLQWMTPWTWAIASRRFQQGVLIRFEQSKAVVTGTIVRLITVGAALGIGYGIGSWSGIAVGAAALGVGVVAEAIYASLRTRQVLPRLHDASAAEEPLTWPGFASFYVPLAFTPILTIALQSIGAAAMNRMPEKLLSTATWSSVYGLVFMFRAAGFAFNEVVVTLIAQRDGVAVLRRIAWLMGIAMCVLLALVAFTPLGELWFGRILELSPHLVEVGIHALAFALLMPGYAVLQSFFQGALVQARKTRAVTEAVALYLSVSAVLLGIGIWLGEYRGIEYALTSFTIAGVLQTVWLWFRSRGVLKNLTT